TFLLLSWNRRELGSVTSRRLFRWDGQAGLLTRIATESASIVRGEISRSPRSIHRRNSGSARAARARGDLLLLFCRLGEMPAQLYPAREVLWPGRRKAEPRP